MQLVKQDTLRGVEGSILGGREVKISADRVLDEIILKALIPTGIPVLSEESGVLGELGDSELIWIIDPLDGSINFLRDLGPSAISIALWQGSVPLFGVLYELSSKTISWGGREFGAWTSGHAIHTSNIDEMSQAIIFTGIPARFPIDDKERVSHFFSKVSGFLKVRMIGTAAISLLKVAQGSGDAYFEDQVMLWDIAAGIAILDGAGGAFEITQENFFSPCKVFATNAHLLAGIREKD